MRALNGYLSVAGETDHPGVRVRCRVDGDALLLAAPGTNLDDWSRFEVDPEQPDPYGFRLTLGGEAFTFTPDDFLEFKYEMVPELDADEPPRPSWERFIPWLSRGARPEGRHASGTGPRLTDLFQVKAARKIRKAITAPRKTPRIEFDVGALLVRGRDTEHEHEFDDQTLPGGLIRSVCRECDHVSIDLRHVEDESGQPNGDRGLFVRARQETGFVRLGRQPEHGAPEPSE